MHKILIGGVLATYILRYIALFSWTLAVWVSYQPLINARQNNNASVRSINALGLIGRILFALYLSAAVLLFEKFSIQWIATKFHEESYAGVPNRSLCTKWVSDVSIERITQQKFAVKVLTTLYRHSHDIPGRSDTMNDGDGKHQRNVSVDPRKFVKFALKGVRSAAKTTTTAFGNVASEIAGSSILQPNSPQAMVQTALESANKTRLVRTILPDQWTWTDRLTVYSWRGAYFTRLLSQVQT